MGTTLTDNTLSTINRKNDDKELTPLRPNLQSELELDNSCTTQSDVMKMDGSSDGAHDALKVLHDDAFLKEEIIYLREETKEKSKLIETLTEALTRNNLKEEINL